MCKFNFDNSKPVSTPIEITYKNKIVDDNVEQVDKTLYQSIVGSLLYLSTKTRPDISFAVSVAARHCNSPNVNNFNSLKRILRYLNGTANLGIMYSKDNISKCVGYSDSDWAGDVKDRKSTSGYCFAMNGGLISWKSCKQTCVALSTAEAEYVALAAATQEAIWLNRLLFEMSNDNNSPILIFEDNQAAIAIANNPKDHPKTKHISIKFHFIREALLNKAIFLQYCPTKGMLADIFTKSLSKERCIDLKNMSKLVTYVRNVD